MEWLLRIDSVGSDQERDQHHINESRINRFRSGIQIWALGSMGPGKIKNIPPWSYPDAAAAAAGPAAATSAAASAVCIYYVLIGGRFAPLYKYVVKYIKQKQQQK